MSKLHKLFVYGTLKDTGDYPKKKATLKGYRMKVISWFPGIKPYDSGEGMLHCVEGQMLSGISDEQLAVFDNYEGYPHLYTRPKVKVELEDGTEEECWVYAYNKNITWPKESISGGGDSVFCIMRDGKILWNFRT